MSTRVSNFPSDVGAVDAVRRSVAFWLVLSLHALAIVLIGTTEVDLLGIVVFLFVWAMLNCLWIVLVRRPSIAALLSLEFVMGLTLISRFKYDKLWMTIDFLDVLIADQDTSAFLLATFPALRWWILAFAVATSAAIIMAWRLDHYRVPLQTSLAGFSISAVALVAISLSCPSNLREDFVGGSYVSKFARTGVEAIQELGSHGYLESHFGDL